jgi:polysaccharide biosynthesis protein PelD
METTPEMTAETRPGLLTRLHDRLPERLFGIKLSALIEVFLFLVTVTLLNVVFGDGRRFIDFEPHPFWIIILLVAAQYGTGEALIASLAATGLLLAWNLPPQAFDESTFDYVFTIAFRPLLWLAAAVVIGELRVRHLQRQQTLEDELSQTRQREQTITRAYEQLKSVKETLETRIAGHLQATMASYQSLKSIEGLSPVQILMGAAEMVENVIHPEKHSVYGFGANGFEVIASEGWTDTDGYSRRIASDSPLFRELVDRRRVLCSINREDADILGTEGILAGPLIDPQDGQFFGMLKIEALDFIDLTTANVETFRILCEWAGSAYAQARQYQETAADAMHNLETGTLSRSFAQFAKHILTVMQTENNVHSQLIELNLTHERRLSNQERIAIAKHLNQILTKRLPTNTMICDGRRRNTQFELLLPGIGQHQAQTLAQELSTWLQNPADVRLQNTDFQLEVRRIDG